MPDGKNDLCSVDFAGDQAVQLLLRLFLVQEVGADNDDAEPGARQTAVD